MYSHRYAGIVPFVLLAIALSKVMAGTADELITLAKSGVDEEVVKAYIENSATPFALTSADIVTLKDLGVPSKVIIEALKHDQPSDSLVNLDSANAYPESTAVPPGPPAVSPVTAPAPDEQNISFFYSALYPYGTWINVDGNWCWQPNATAVDEDWEPYCNHGRWVWTDYGWTWASNYTWGWAPFHYGRWFRRDPYGWLWLPDNAWGPAWVTWRTGDNYCGWAPLPPRGRFVPGQGFFFGERMVGDDPDFGYSYNDFFFVPLDHFHDRHLFAHVLPPANAGDIYRRTRFVKNGYSVANNHLVNEGVPVSAVEMATKSRIKPLTLSAEQLGPGVPIHATTVSETKLILYKPSLSAAAPESPPAIKERFTRTPAGFGQIVTPHTNPQSWETLQNSQRNAAEQAGKNQRAVAQTAQAEKTRLDAQAQKETDQSKRAALLGEEAVQAMRAQKAQQHAQKAQSWKPPQEIIVPRAEPWKPPQETLAPKPQPAQPVQRPVVRAEPVGTENKQAVAKVPEIRQPANVPAARPPTEQFQNQVKELNSEARMEQQRRVTVESTVRTQAQSQWLPPQQTHQEASPNRGAGSGKERRQ